MKQQKRIFVIAMILIMFISTIPFKAYASTTPGIVNSKMALSRINTLIEKLEGKYFTTDGNPDYGHYNYEKQEYECGEQCHNIEVIQNSRFKDIIMTPDDSGYLPNQFFEGRPIDGNNNGYSCFGFACYAQWFIFAQKSSDHVEGLKFAETTFKKDFIQNNVYPGDIIRVNGHSMIYISSDDSGFIVLDNNWSYDNKIQKHIVTWEQYDNKPCWISRPSNSSPSSSLVQLDLAFVVDTTGSMSDDINAVKNNMNSILEELDSNDITYRIALVDYRDFSSRTGTSGDYPYMVQLDFSDDHEEITSAINNLSLGNGGDTKETLYSALVDGLKDLNWADTSAKSVIVMGDAAPLDPEPITGYTIDIVNTVLSGMDYSSGYSEVTDLESVDSKLLFSHKSGSTAYSAETAETNDEEDSTVIEAIIPGETIVVYTIDTSTSGNITEFVTLAQNTGGRAFTGNSSNVATIIDSIIAYIPNDIHIHTPGAVVIENETSSCTDGSGYDEVIYCNECGLELSRIRIKTGELAEHTPAEAVLDEVINPTCISTGECYLVTYCSVCGDELSREKLVIDAIGHTSGKAVKETITVTDNETGEESFVYEKVIYCSVCGEEVFRGAWIIDHTHEDYDEDGCCDYCSERTCRLCGEFHDSTSIMGWWLSFYHDILYVLGAFRIIVGAFN